MKSHARKRLVAVVGFDGISAFHLSVPCMVFADALPEGSPFEVVVCAAEKGTVRTRTGFGLTDLAPLSVLKRADAIVVPSWRDVDEAAPGPCSRLCARRTHAVHKSSACAWGLMCWRKQDCWMGAERPHIGSTPSPLRNVFRASTSMLTCSMWKTAMC